MSIQIIQTMSKHLKKKLVDLRFWENSSILLNEIVWLGQFKWKKSPKIEKVRKSYQLQSKIDISRLIFWKKITLIRADPSICQWKNFGTEFAFLRSSPPCMIVLKSIHHPHSSADDFRKCKIWFQEKYFKNGDEN